MQSQYLINIRIRGSHSKNYEHVLLQELKNGKEHKRINAYYCNSNLTWRTVSRGEDVIIP